jgi:type IV pilus assembly PilX-like protein
MKVMKKEKNQKFFSASRRSWAIWRCLTPLLSDCSGMALILCLLVMSTLSLIGTIAYNICTLNQKIVHNNATQTKAFYAAEAGREQAVAFLRSNLLWRGGDTGETGFHEGGLGEEKGLGSYSVTLSDCTNDENGIFDALIPGCYVKLFVTGAYRDSMQTSACLVKFSPNLALAANAPFKAVVTSGKITGSGASPIKGVNDWGVASSQMIAAETPLPTINRIALQALADTAFSNLDNKEFKAHLSARSSFWKDEAATQPYILHVQGDLILSDKQHLYGIVFIEGDLVSISGDVCVDGILYAPNADRFIFHSSSTTPQPVVTGQVVTGSSGIAVAGNGVTIQLDHDYVASFNLVAGPEVRVEMQSGSWASFPSAY